MVIFLISMHPLALRCANFRKVSCPVDTGDLFSLTREFSRSDVERFLKLSGDTNGIHSSYQIAHNCGFHDIILPGALIVSVFSAIMGSHLPGPGSIYLSQNFQFRSPLHIDEPVTFNVCIKRRFPQSGIFVMLMKASVEEKLGVEGHAIGKNTLC